MGRGLRGCGRITRTRCGFVRLRERVDRSGLIDRRRSGDCLGGSRGCVARGGGGGGGGRGGAGEGGGPGGVGEGGGVGGVEGGGRATAVGSALVAGETPPAASVDGEDSPAADGQAEKGASHNSLEALIER